MATADSVKAKLQGLIDAANAATGAKDADLTTAVQSLIDGFGQSGDIGGLNLVSGTWTPAEDTMTCRITGLDGSPHAFVVAPAFSQDDAQDGVAKLLGAMWVRGVWYLWRTNASGTTTVGDNSSLWTLENFVIQGDDYAIGSGKVEVLQTGFAIYRAGYYFRAGLIYNWAAIV